MTALSTLLAADLGSSWAGLLTADPGSVQDPLTVEIANLTYSRPSCDLTLTDDALVHADPVTFPWIPADSYVVAVGIFDAPVNGNLLFTVLLGDPLHFTKGGPLVLGDGITIHLAVVEDPDSPSAGTGAWVASPDGPYGGTLAGITDGGKSYTIDGTGPPITVHREGYDGTNYYFDLIGQNYFFIDGPAYTDGHVLSNPERVYSPTRSITISSGPPNYIPYATYTVDPATGPYGPI